MEKPALITEVVEIVHKIFHEAAKRSYWCHHLEHDSKTIQNPQKVELEILKGHIYAIKNPSSPFLPSSPPNGQRDHLSNTKSLTLFHPSSPSH